MPLNKSPCSVPLIDESASSIVTRSLTLPVLRVSICQADLSGDPICRGAILHCRLPTRASSHRINRSLHLALPISAADKFSDNKRFPGSFCCSLVRFSTAKSRYGSAFPS